MRLTKPRTALSLSLFILCGSLSAAFFLGYVPFGAGAQAGCTNCYNGGVDPPWTWPQNTHVTVNISGSFTADQQREIAQAFRNWQNNPNIHSGVTYSFTFGGPFVINPNTIQVIREVPPGVDVNNTPGNPNDDEQPLGAADPQFNASNTHIQSGVIRLHPSITNIVALLETAVHEIGHFYGLNECPDCCAGTSAMTGAAISCTVPCTNSAYYNDVSMGTSAPSNCDAANARQAGGYDPATECPDANGNGTCDAEEGGDPCGGDPCCGDPYCGDPCGGDPYCGDPCGGDPCCGDPSCGYECEWVEFCVQTCWTEWDCYTDSCGDTWCWDYEVCDPPSCEWDCV